MTIIDNQNHRIKLIFEGANFIYNKYQIFEYDNDLLFWDEIKHPSGKLRVLSIYNLK